MQVKEKFGTLRFYTRTANEEQRGMIWMAEAISARICEECGNRGQRLVLGGWHLTRCRDHTPPDAIPWDECLSRAARGETRQSGSQSASKQSSE